MRKKYFVLVLLFVVHLFILSRLTFTAWPEMVSFPYLINHGFVTYTDMVHAYPPLLVNILAVLYKIFGYNPLVLKFFGWTLALISDVLIFFIVRKVTKNEKVALATVFIYVVLQPLLEGNMVWPDLAIVPFLLLTFLFLMQKKYFWGGGVIALAVLTKQTGFLFLGISGLWLLLFERKLRCIWYFVLGILVVLLPFLFSLLHQNSLREFWNWTIFYPSKYWISFPGYVQLTLSKRDWLIVLALVFPVMYVLFRKREVFKDKLLVLLISFAIAGIIGVYPRFSFFHFQSALSFLIIIFGYLMSKGKEFGRIVIVSFMLIVAIIFPRISTFEIKAEDRFWSQSDIHLAQTIKENTKENNKIFLLGLPSGLYVYADQIPPKPWLDNFGWYLEIPQVQEEVIAGFEKDPPATIFWQTPIDGNWFDLGVYQPKKITEWIERNYSKIGEIEKGVSRWERKI